MIAGMTGNMMSLSWQRREHGKRRRRNRRTSASNVHWTADIAGVGSGEKPSACLISKTNVCNYVLTQDVHGTCGRTLIWTHLPAKVGPTRRPSGLLNREGQWTGEPKWNFSKRSGESTSLEPERCVR